MSVGLRARGPCFHRRRGAVFADPLLDFYKRGVPACQGAPIQEKRSRPIRNGVAGDFSGKLGRRLFAWPSRMQMSIDIEIYIRWTEIGGIRIPLAVKAFEPRIFRVNDGDSVLRRTVGIRLGRFRQFHIDAQRS